MIHVMKTLQFLDQFSKSIVSDIKVSFFLDTGESLKAMMFHTNII